jgi:CRISPR-associated protein Cas2
MFWIVCYDITDDKRRRKVADILESYGQRAQYSVFECDMSGRQQMTLQGQLQRVIDESEDDIRFYPLNEADIARVETLGRKAKINRLPAFYITP